MEMAPPRPRLTGRLTRDLRYSNRSYRGAFILSVVDPLASVRADRHPEDARAAIRFASLPLCRPQTAGLRPRRLRNRSPRVGFGFQSPVSLGCTRPDAGWPRDRIRIPSGLASRTPGHPRWHARG